MTDRGNPDLFYILHVEDEEDFASIDSENSYWSILKKPVEDSLSCYGVEAKHIRWELARSLREALEKISVAKNERPDRPFDAVICDLAIPRIHTDSSEKSNESDGGVDWRNGFEILKSLTKGEHRGCTASLIVVSTYASDDKTISEAEREAKKENIRFDDWIQKTGKNEVQDSASLVAKFRRCLIPTDKYAHLCSRLSPPSLFISHKMRQLLRNLIFIAGKDYSPDRPLAKILILGEPGSGKGMLARTFYALLRLLDQERARLGLLSDENDQQQILAEAELEKSGHQIGEPGRWRMPFRMKNCAQLVADGGHGGRIDLFGTRRFQGIDDARGVFEECSYYNANATEPALDSRRRPLAGSTLAAFDEQPVIERAGVVFLDEFADMIPILQASVLNALEDGVIQREGSSQRNVRIGCHVVCATNFDPWSCTEGDSRSVRSDLIDRIPYILRMPPLRERPEEIQKIVEALATHRAGKPVSLSESALKLLQKSVDPGRTEDALITSVRQLQMIADVLEGESIITDSNLAPLFEKARIYHKEEVLLRERDYEVLVDSASSLYDQMFRNSSASPLIENETQVLSDVDCKLVELVQQILLHDEMVQKAKTGGNPVASWMNSPGNWLVRSSIGLANGSEGHYRWRLIFAVALISAANVKEGLQWTSVAKVFQIKRTPQTEFQNQLVDLFQHHKITVVFQKSGADGGLKHLINYIKNPDAYPSSKTDKSTFQPEFSKLEETSTDFLARFRHLLVSRNVIAE